MSESLATQYSPTQTPAKPAASASGYEGIFSPAARRHGECFRPQALRARHQLTRLILLAESFAAGEAPLHTSLIADQIFEEMAAEGELSNVALSRLLVLYGQKTLEAALGLLVNDRAATRPCVLASFRKAEARHFARRTRTGFRSWSLRVAGRSSSSRALRTSLTVCSFSTACLFAPSVAGCNRAGLVIHVLAPNLTIW